MAKESSRKRSRRYDQRPARTSRRAGDGSNVRLQKVLAAAGFGSRRHCEGLITDGRVQVDRTVVSELGVKVDPESQEIRVDGDVIERPTLRYYVLNKPQGVLSTNADPDGRVRVVDLIGDSSHLFTIGRLDRSSEGLIIVTNDGDMANKIAHPSYQVNKVYTVRVAGSIQREQLAEVRQGVYLSDGKANVESIRVKRRHKQTTELEMVLAEGKNREIRRVLARVGHKVLQLKRIAIGPVRLGELPEGAYRELTVSEVKALKLLTSEPSTPSTRRKFAKRKASTGNDKRKNVKKTPRSRRKPGGDGRGTTPGTTRKSARGAVRNSKKRSTNSASGGKRKQAKKRNVRKHG